MSTITDTTPGPQTVPSGNSILPFTDVSIDQTVIVPTGQPFNAGGTLTITLTGPSGDPLGSITTNSIYTTGTWSGSTWTQACSEGELLPFDPSSFLQGDAYVAPMLAPGQSETVDAWISYTDDAKDGGATTSDPNPIVIDVDGPPLPTPTLVAPPTIIPSSDAATPIVLVSGGGGVFPFAGFDIDQPWATATGGGNGTVTVTLQSTTAGSSLGSLVAATNLPASQAPTFDAATESISVPTLSGVHPGALQSPGQALQDISYIPPTLPAGTDETVDAFISYTVTPETENGAGTPQTVTDPNPIVINVEGPPMPDPPPVVVPPVITSTTPPIDTTTVPAPPPLLISGDPMSDASQISRLYYATLDRGPDPVGLAYWNADMQAGASINQIATGFINSPEFLAETGSASANPGNFVIQLYENVLDRVPDPDGYACWTTALGTGQLSPEQVVTGFSNSQEFINKVG